MCLVGMKTVFAWSVKAWSLLKSPDGGKGNGNHDSWKGALDKPFYLKTHPLGIAIYVTRTQVGECMKTGTNEESDTGTAKQSEKYSSNMPYPHPSRHDTSQVWWAREESPSNIDCYCM